MPNLKSSRCRSFPAVIQSLGTGTAPYPLLIAGSELSVGWLRASLVHGLISIAVESSGIYNLLRTALVPGELGTQQEVRGASTPKLGSLIQFFSLNHLPCCGSSRHLMSATGVNMSS